MSNDAKVKGDRLLLHTDNNLFKLNSVYYKTPKSNEK